MKYCEHCGKKLENGEKCSCPESSAASAKAESRKKQFIFGGIAIVVVLAIAALISVISVSSKENPLDYVAIEFSGYNTLGEADIDFDCDALIESVIGVAPETPEEYFKWLANYDSYFNSIETSYSSTEALSNGDTVTVKIIVSGTAESKIASVEKAFTVEGLPEIQFRDVFQDVDISFVGVSGNGEMRLSLKAEDEILEACRFQYSQQYYLAVGETITVSVSNAEKIAENYGVVISPASKEYEVTGLSEFLSDPELLPKEDIAKFAEIFLSDTNPEENWMFSYDEPQLYGAYFCVAKQEGFMIEDNVLKIFICYDEYINGEYHQTIYKSLDFSEIVASPDGKVDLTYDMGICDSYLTNMESHLEELNEDYTVVALDIQLDDDCIAENIPAETEENLYISDSTGANSSQSNPIETTTAQSTSTSSSSNNGSHIHEFGPYMVNTFKMPTETKAGEIFRFCYCGYRDSQTIPSINYNVTDPETGEHICAIYPKDIPATCIKPAYLVKLCTGCDFREEYPGASSVLANHTYSEWVIIKAATATEQGKQSRTCSVCGKENTEVIPATGEQREYYIDSRLTIETLPDGATSYSIDELHLGVIDTRTWGTPPSIYIIDELYLSVSYYTQSGEKISCTVQQITERYANVVINDDGSYHHFSVGDYND